MEMELRMVLVELLAIKMVSNERDSTTTDSLVEQLRQSAQMGLADTATTEGTTTEVLGTRKEPAGMQTIKS